MQKASYNRLFVTEIVIAALFSAAFAGFFTWVLFGTDAIATSVDKNRLSFDCFVQTFMTTLFAYAFPGFSARMRVRKGKLAPLSSGIDWINRVPFPIQVVLAAALATLTLGVLAALMTHMFVTPPVPNMSVMAAKIAYGVLLSAIVTSVALLAGLSPRSAA